jgi:hypothetical protein
MDGDIIVRGTVLAQKQSMTGEKRDKVAHTVQLMKRNGKQAVELLNVKLPDGADPTKYQEGAKVELAVDVSTFEGSIYYRATRDLLNGKPDTRASEPRSAPIKP